jgi:phosphoribosylglycinamide formyltransferase-1
MNDDVPSDTPPRRFSIAVLLSGQGRTLANLLTHIERDALPVDIRCVIGSKPGIGGLAIAANAGISTHIIQRRDFPDTDAFSAANWDVLSAYDPQLIVHAGFLHKLLVAPGWEGRVINIHPSLLPAFGGKGMYGHHVHAAVLAHGCKVSGCTVHICDDAYDAGPIVAQRCVPVMDDDTPETLGDRVFAAESVLYPVVIRAFAEGRIHQAGRRVTIAAKMADTRRAELSCAQPEE